MKYLKLVEFILVFYCCFIFVKVVGLILQKKKILDKPSGSILYLAAFFPNNAGYIYRVKKWAEILLELGFVVDIKFALHENEYDTYLNSPIVNETGFYKKCLLNRVRQVLSVRNYDVIVVRRELLLFNDYGNLFLEKFLIKIHPNVILDFDDDIAFAKNEPKNVSSVFSKLMMEHSSKFTASIKLYSKFIVGSNYLKDYVLNINRLISNNDICVIPTSVDYDKYPLKNYEISNRKQVVTFGWIGSVGNLKLLNNIITVLNEIHKRNPLKLLVISGKDFLPNVDFEIENIKWNYETQISNMLKIDIGLMPLNNTFEDKGKCGFKLIQYMGLGIVSVATGVTINNEIINDKINGFLVNDQNANWCEVLFEVLDNKYRFQEIGLKAREKVKSNYSFKANKGVYVEFLTRYKVN